MKSRGLLLSPRHPPAYTDLAAEKMVDPFHVSSKKLGLELFSAHRRFASQSRRLGHLALPGDFD